MPYRLLKDESIASGMKRVAEEQVTAAIDHLQANRVYQARKSLKKMRAVLCLVEPQLGPVYTEENRRLRDVARRFSALRDTDVSLELLEGFAKQYKRKSTLNPQRKALLERRAALEYQLAQMTEPLGELAGTRKRIEDWPLHGIAVDVLERQADKTHKQSRRAFDRARETRTPEDFHELRKSVKRELNQLRLLKPIGPWLNDLKQLSTLLGDHHNLAVLAATLETSGRFRQMARRQQKLYESQVLTLASRVYDS